jgi:PAS domain S-box-containing protein
MYAVLGATNEALLYAKTPTELFQRVCDAAVDGRKFLTAAVTSPDADTAWLKVEAASGLAAQQLREARISVDENTAEGRGLVGEAYRHNRSAISNEFMRDERTRPWHEVGQRAGVAAGAAIPIVRGDRAVGVMLFYSASLHAFSEDIIALLERMARNIVFALDNFERENERQQAEKALRHSEEKFRNILDSLDDAYYEVDTRGKPVYHNPAFSQMLGYDYDYRVGEDNRNRQTPEMAAVVFKAFNEVYRTGISKSGQRWQYLHRNGSVIHVEGSVLLVKDANGKPVGFRGILRNVTERLRVDEALRTSEARFRAMTNLSSDWYWEQDADYRFTRLESRAASEYTQPNPLLGPQHLGEHDDRAGRGGLGRLSREPGCATVVPRRDHATCGAGAPRLLHQHEWRAGVRCFRRFCRLPRHLARDHRPEGGRRAHPPHGTARQPHRPAQPHDVQQPAERGHPDRRPLQAQLRGDVHRP